MGGGRGGGKGEEREGREEVPNQTRLGKTRLGNEGGEKKGFIVLILSPLGYT